MSEEPGVPADGGDQRALIARLRAVIEAKNTENALLRAGLEAQLERYRLSGAEGHGLERQLGEQKDHSRYPAVEGPDPGARAAQGRAKERAVLGAGAAQEPRERRPARASWCGTAAGPGPE